jgi:hypothetical protein
VHHCFLVRPDATVEASAIAPADDGSWLGTLPGKCAAGRFLLCPTDDGVVRVEASGPELAAVKRFPDTSAFVDANTRLLPGPGGLYAVQDREVMLLAMQ